MMSEYAIHLPRPHAKQKDFIASAAKRKVVRAGRRGGKTVGVSIYAIEEFLKGRRVLYATPTQDQIDRFWLTATGALSEPIDAGVLYKNETRHIIEVKGTENRIRAKTAWNADTLRGDYADVLIFDEFQLMAEDSWKLVGAPMLLDNNGDAIFIYTPPSLEHRGASKAKDKRHAAKMFSRAKDDKSGRWEAFHFTSYDNPHISKEALEDIAKDMTALAVRMEIGAEDVDEAPGALWERKNIDEYRVAKMPDLIGVVVGVDPAITSEGDETGIITVGNAQEDHLYILADDSTQGSPNTWATAAVTAFYRHKADKIIAESNQGGEMVASTIGQVDKSVPVELVHATRGKYTRAQPIAAAYEKGRGHHVGVFDDLEDEMCLWIPGNQSPNRLDALVWGGSYLLKVGDLAPSSLVAFV